jgi:CheY-like chemotaxis protein
MDVTPVRVWLEMWTKVSLPLQEGAMGDPRVLIVADDDLGELCGLSLQSSQWTTRIVPDAASARDALEAGERCSAIVLGVSNPTNWDVCFQLEKRAGGIPVVVVSGWAASDGRFRRRAFDAGCAVYVLKPCTPDPLVEAVQRAHNGERRIVVVDRGDIAAG